ncbi:carbohydrate ABC transporter permease [Natronohydrobacter thiooxidans]|jgi:multiple sugar transport system permease protein|uniref:carbohydrate ABC transporter permease n=1 Tax=Natronohydrobacter thiooxidans TaxID=87172 RepID=UPI0008FF5C4D|nr:sugar ABC transporter permease [Natronohydrobacter thiooxidans]
MRVENNQRRQMAMMSLPALVFTVSMIAFPFIYTIWMSFQTYSSTGQITGWGGGNYRRMIDDAQFWNGIWITFYLYALSLVMQLVLGTGLALLLFRAKRLPGILRSLFISPFLMPPVVAGMMWLVILDPSLGAANWILTSLGLPPSDWLASPMMVVPTLAIIDTWQWTPYVALIVLGGLQSLPPSVYEAAEIDGASRRAVFFRITLPLLLPTLVTAMVLRSVDLLRFFDLIYITTQGGPSNHSMTLNIYGFRQGFEFFQLGYASALMVTLSVMVLGAVIALNRLRAGVEW